MVELDRRSPRMPRFLRSLGALLAVVAVIGVVPAAAQATELPTVTAHVTKARATEGGARDPGVVEITRTGDLGDALDVNYTTLYSSASRGQDYRHPAEGTPNGWRAITATVRIPADDRSVELPFVPLPDKLTEGRETVVVTISHADRTYAIGEPRDATITIVDDEEPETPGTPHNLVATRVGKRRVSLAWTDDITNETGFTIEQRAAGSSGYRTIATVPAFTTSYLVKGVTPGTRATFRVVATNESGRSAPSDDASADARPPKRPAWLENATVANEKGRFKAWPANGNSWSWGDEIVVMYEDGELQGFGGNRHALRFDQPLAIEQARSIDGGKTWSVEKDPIVKPGAPGFPADGLYGPSLQELDKPVDFEDPDFALHVRMSNKDYGPSYWYYSNDRARTWKGPYELPFFGLGTVNSRTDYIVEGRRSILLFLSGTEDSNFEDNSYPFVVRSTDGGATWKLVSKLADAGIQPSTVRVARNALVSTSRTVDGVDIFRSTDDGGSWSKIANVSVDPTGRMNSPGSLTRLEDGRLVITYGYRSPPFGVRARSSDDDGESWSDEVVLRADGASFDLGYTEDVLRPDGKIVTTYYFTSDPLAERTIEATIWDPVAAFGAARRG